MERYFPGPLVLVALSLAKYLQSEFRRVQFRHGYFLSHLTLRFLQATQERACCPSYGGVIPEAALLVALIVEFFQCTE